MIRSLMAWAAALSALAEAKSCGRGTYPLADADVDLILLGAGDELGALVVKELAGGLAGDGLVGGAAHGRTYIEALGALAEGGVVLLDEVPADLVLGDLGRAAVVAGLALGSLGSVAGGGGVVGLRRIAAIDRDA